MNMEQYWREYDRSLDPPDEPPVVAECESCGAELYEGDEAIKYEGDIYCDSHCLISAIDYTNIYIGDE